LKEDKMKIKTLLTALPIALPIALFVALIAALADFPAAAQTPADIAALKGLAAVTVLGKTPEGRAALAANYAITGGIQTGDVRQSTLLPFSGQQQQSLRDAFVTASNLAQLSDGLGTTLGAAYLARAHCGDWTHCTNLSQPIADLISYANATSANHSNAGKYFLANETTDGKTPVSAEAMAILKANGGDTDVFGKNYNLPAGAPGADAYGNSRPFQTEPSTLPIVGPDYLNVPSNNTVYSRGPAMNLINSPSYPSGHTTYGYTGSLILAILVPDRYQEMIARGAEYGNSRILLGAHYAMDVLGGRTLALYDMAHLLANDPLYTGRTYTGATYTAVTTIQDFQAAMKAARADLKVALEAACGKTLAECAREDIGRLSNPAADAAFYASTQTYNLPVVYTSTAHAVEDVGKLDKDAGYLLTAAFPSLTLEEADRILTETEGPGGGFLDDGSPFGVYSRLDLYTAAGKAAALSHRAKQR
jgi:PAP2 superfamily